MAKKGKLGKVETCYIDNNFGKISTSQIAIDLDRSESQIQQYISGKQMEVESVDTQTTQPIVTEKRHGISAGDMMARKFGPDGRVLATVMTAGASEKMDDAKSKNKSRTTNGEHIHRPLEAGTIKRRRKVGG